MSTLKLIAVGDISLQTQNNRPPFKNVRHVFQGKDILFGNLETVLSNQGRKTEQAVLLHLPPEKVKYLKDAGFDVLNIANNHILDLGAEGFKDTLDTLSKSGLTFIGASNSEYGSSYTIVEKNGIKLGFLGYTIGRFNVPQGISINKLKESKILIDIESIKEKSDIVIVSLHWGTENAFYPSPKQIDLAHRLVDHGATLILGHHPHVIQGIEEYKNGLVAYSLGNFQFDPKLSQSKTNDSMILSVNFNKAGVKDYNVLPMVIDADFLPCVVEGQQKDKLLHFFADISRPIRNGEITNRWWFSEICGEYLSGNMRNYKVRIKKYGVRHLLECMVWLISPFCLRCYAAIIKRRLRGERPS